MPPRGGPSRGSTSPGASSTCPCSSAQGRASTRPGPGTRPGTGTGTGTQARTRSRPCTRPRSRTRPAGRPVGAFVTEAQIAPTRAGRLDWRALGTYVYLATSRPDAMPVAERTAQDVLAQVDRACSRFRPDSDLVRANDRAGSWVQVDPLLAAAVSVALEAAAETEGLVDPTLGLTLVAAGYDRDFALLPAAARLPSAVPVPAREGAWREVAVDREGALRVPLGCTLDLGATGKAWAADLVARCIVEATGSDVVVSLGGDVAVDGPDGNRVAWPVAVSEDVDAPDDAEVVMLPYGGLATSGTRSRRWVRGGTTRHHVIDPRTGQPTGGPWRTISATGISCVAANTASTAALIMAADAETWLNARDVPARLVAQDGTVVRTSRWPEPLQPNDWRQDNG